VRDEKIFGVDVVIGFGRGNGKGDGGVFADCVFLFSSLGLVIVNK
jgi:hypothetical protein